MTTYGYTRVSSVEQVREDRVSLAFQARTIQGCAMMRGDGDPVIYSDPAISGAVSFRDRPAGGRLMAVMRRGDALIVSKMDRMFRSARDALNSAEEFRVSGINLVLCDMGTEPITNSGTSKIFFGILAIMAEFERERTAERTAEGRKGKRVRGGHIGGHPPYGYRVVGAGMSAMLAEYLPEQRVIRMIHDMKASGVGPNEITRRLEAQGIANRLGKSFGKTQVLRILGRADEMAA